MIEIDREREREEEEEEREKFFDVGGIGAALPLWFLNRVVDDIFGVFIFIAP